MIAVGSGALENWGYQMAKASAIVLVTATFACSLFAQQPPPDLLGWQGTRWGMTSDEIAAAVGPELKRMPKPVFFKGCYAEDYLPAIELAGRPFEVLFQKAQSDDRLQQVLFRCKDDTIGKAAQPQGVLFNSIEELLTRKYGAATLRHGRPGLDLDASVSWVFPTTTIELWHLYIARVASILTITYFPTGRGTEKL
jgi:hypothetical protein